MTTNFLKNILLISIIIWLIGLLCFSIVSIIDYSFLLGWCFGYLLSLSGYFLNILTSKLFFRKRRSKINGFWLGYARAMIQIIWYFILCFFFIWIDVFANGDDIFSSGKLSDVLYPMNIFSFIIGTSIIILSIFINVVVFKIINKRKKGING